MLDTVLPLFSNQNRAKVLQEIHFVFFIMTGVFFTYSTYTHICIDSEGSNISTTGHYGHINLVVQDVFLWYQFYTSGSLDNCQKEKPSRYPANMI